MFIRVKNSIILVYYSIAVKEAVECYPSFSAAGYHFRLKDPHLEGI
jgi:hypothetical protein